MDIACPACAETYEIDDASVTASGRKVRCAACSVVWRVFPDGYNPETGLPMPQPDEAALSRRDNALTWGADQPEPAVTEAAPEAPAETTPAVIEAELPSEPPAEEAQAATVQAETVQAATVEETPAPAARGAKWTKDKKAKKAGGAWKKLLGWQTGAIAATVVILISGVVLRERVVRHVPQTASLYAAIGLPVNLRGIVIRNVASRVVTDNDESVLVVDGDLVNITDRRIDVPRLHFTLLGKDGQQLYVWSAQADRSVLQPGEKLNFRRRLAAPPEDAKDVKVRFLTRSDMTAGIK
jgi:predicted Zn finger-like uncharacterized protein